MPIFQNVLDNVILPSLHMQRMLKIFEMLLEKNGLLGFMCLGTAQLTIDPMVRLCVARVLLQQILVFLRNPYNLIPIPFLPQIKIQCP